jgi:glutamine---fructose-6-phosphate transaminase (isomerizing)
MCGIVGYVGDGTCKQFILEGLSRLEYRGYDSAGLVCLDPKHSHFVFHKVAGGVSLIKKLADEARFDGSIGMGHTRWATHGVVDEKNAHPHFNCDNTVAVIHNGVIENYEALRKELLEKNHHFYSSTDTEVIAHIASDLYDATGSLEQMCLELVKKIRGAYAILLMFEKEPHKLIALRHRSPLVMAQNKNDIYIASDLAAFSDKATTASFLPDDSFAILSAGSIKVFDFTGNPITPTFEAIDQKYASMDKDGFEHYMLKEIYEQKRAITRTIYFCRLIGSKTSKYSDSVADSFRHSDLEDEYSDQIWRQLGLTKDQAKHLKSLNLVAAGTSWHAARIAQFFFEIVAKIPCQVSLASEFRYMPFFPKENSAYIFISQSGETADTLEALRLVNSFELPSIAITNVASSTMVREAGGFLPMQAGPEISVASTKAFSTQIATLYWLAHRVALEGGTISWNDMHAAEEDLFVAAEILETLIENYKFKIVNELAPKYAQFERFIFLGRHINYPFALEASLKLKEISYIFSQCYPAGELKHGPIALIDEKTPVVLFSILDDVLYWKILSNAQEVKARKGHLIIFAFEGQTELIDLADTVFIIPLVKPLLAPMAMTGLMQFFVYHITRALGRPIDRPRNLAKSVTVE